MIKTFRGLMADLAQDTIVLHTNDGSTGYRIVKFQIIGNEPGEKSQEALMKIYKVSQSSVDGIVDFSDNTLLAVGYWSIHPDPQYGESNEPAIIFDREIFNQDIYVTYKDMNVGESCNYYIELEQVKLDLNQNTVATLKDIRNVTAP